MNKKISLGLALSLVIITAAASFAVTMAYSQKIYNKMLPRLSERLERIYVLEDIEAIIGADYYFADNIDEKKLNEFLAKGYIEGLNDKYSRYFSAEQYDDYVNKIEGKTHGIGVIISKSNTGTIYVSDVAPGSPAAIEGIVSGDEIVKINNETVKMDNYETMAAKLEGMSLKTITITFKHEGTEKTVNVTIGYDSQSIAYSAYGATGYIKITGFYKNTPKQLDNAIAELTKTGVTGIVFDVRNSSEGTIEYAAKTVDVLVPLATESDNVIATAYDSSKTPINTFPSDAKELTLPMAVLVNENSSGCAELFAISLVDFKNAPVVGVKTPGNNTMQELFPLKSGGAILLTVAEIKPYITESYIGGIIPQDIITLTEEEKAIFNQLPLEKDPQFLVALKYFAKGNDTDENS